MHPATVSGNTDRRVIIDYDGMPAKRPIQPVAEARQHICDDWCVEFRGDLKAAREMRLLFAPNSPEGEDVYEVRDAAFL
jgi:hypothetical protein